MMRTHSRALIDLLRQYHAPDDEFEMVEVGVWRGINAEALLQTFPSLILHLIDNESECDEKDQLSEALERLESFEDRCRWYMKDSVDAAQQFEKQSMDCVFIDADHSYHAVCLDLRAWWPIVKPGCCISGHDYNGVGDRKGRFGVKKAVDEFFGEGNVREHGGLVWSVLKGPSM